MNFDVKFDNCPLHFSAKFIEDDSSFEGFGQDLQLIHGKDGKSAYEVAVANGFEGTEAEWLESLHGEDGIDGKDGAPGRDGQDGQPGRDGLDGKDYILTEADKQEIAEQAAELIDVPEGGEGTTDHNELTNRDAADQHPIEAITGLADALKAKLTKDDVDLVLAQAKESGEFDGKDGKDGLDGQPGKDGQDGYTPVKGKDYYTEADKAELVEEVLEQIPEQPSGGISVDKAEIGQTIVVKAVDENGKPTEWEAADLPTGGGSSVQPDWNQNDESQPDYVKNRTHYTIQGTVDIVWDGDVTDRTVLDLSSMGMDGVLLAKVSDRVYTKEEMEYAVLLLSNSSYQTKYGEDDLFDPLPGVFATTDFNVFVVYSAAETNAALGAPDGYLTDGTYFFLDTNTGVYVWQFGSQDRVKKLDEKYFPDIFASKEYVDRADLSQMMDAEASLDGSELRKSFVELSTEEFVEAISARPEVRMIIHFSTYGVRTPLCRFEKDGYNYVATTVQSFVVGELGSNGVYDHTAIKTYVVYLVADPVATTITSWAKELI